MDFLRDTISQAKRFEKLIMSDNRFELVCKVEFSLVCFRIVKDKNNSLILKDELQSANMKFLEILNQTRDIFLVGSKVNDVYFLRCAFGTTNSTDEDVDFLWSKILDSINNFEI